MAVDEKKRQTRASKSEGKKERGKYNSEIFSLFRALFKIVSGDCCVELLNIYLSLKNSAKYERMIKRITFEDGPKTDCPRVVKSA